MEQIVLSREEYDGGQRLVRRLMEQGFAVLAAFWARRADDRMWTLHVVSPRVGTVESLTNHLELRLALDSLEPEWSHPFERLGADRVRLLAVAERIAERVVDLLTKYALPLPRWHHTGLPWPCDYDDVLLCPVP